MATVGERLEKAQASGDLAEIKAALEDARAAGADPQQIEEALAEVERASAARGPPTAAGGGGGGPAGEAAEAEAAAAAELRARAEAHKKRGNERLKANTKSAAREALECFTSGLEVRCSDLVLNAQLFSNRAHVRILLRQFVEAVDDCRKAIELDPKNVKAYWRAAKASLNLDLCRNGIEFCEAGLQQEPKDEDLLRLRDVCAEKLASQRQRRSELSAKARASLGDFSADEAMAVQEKVSGLSEQIEALRLSMRNKQLELRKASLTADNIKDTPAETRLYSTVGRCFLLQDRATIDAQLSSTIQGLEAELPKLAAAHQELEKRREGAEKELKEMIDAFRRQSEPSAAGAA